MASQRASIYKLSTHFVVCPLASTSAGIGVAVGPYQVLPASASVAALGEAVGLALDASDTVIPDPVDWKALATARRAAAGVRSESAFQKHARLVSARADGAALFLTTHTNGGASGPDKGFSPSAEHAAQPRHAPPAVLGKAILDAFGVSR